MPGSSDSNYFGVRSGLRIGEIKKVAEEGLPLGVEAILNLGCSIREEKPGPVDTLLCILES